MKELDVLIIGSGPAGNTAGIYLVRNGFKVAIITGMEIGGQLTITTDVENYPGFVKGINGFELMNAMIQQSENLGVEIIYDTVNSINFDEKPFICKTENNEEIIAKNVIIATGASAKYLGLESEKKFIGYGVSACATCDGNFFKNKIVSVIGGGRTAAIEALHLSHLAEKVIIIYRKDKFARIEEDIINKIYNTKNIEILFNTEIVEILGDDNPLKVTKIKIINNITEKEETIKMDGVFIAIGRTPNTTIFKNSNLRFDANGYIITENDSCRTNIKYVYAAGDVINKKVKQAVVAAAYGCIASAEIEEDNR